MPIIITSPASGQSTLGLTSFDVTFTDTTARAAGEIGEYRVVIQRASDLTTIVDLSPPYVVSDRLGAAGSSYTDTVTIPTTAGQPDGLTDGELVRINVYAHSPGALPAQGQVDISGNHFVIASATAVATVGSDGPRGVGFRFVAGQSVEAWAQDPGSLPTTNGAQQIHELSPDFPRLQVTRLTGQNDANSGGTTLVNRPEYSEHSAVDAGGNWAISHRGFATSPVERTLIRLSDFQRVVAPAGATFFWSNRDPGIAYTTNGAQLLRYDADQAFAQGLSYQPDVIFTWDQTLSNGGQGGMDDESRYFVSHNGNNSNKRVVIYDTIANTVYREFTFTFAENLDVIKMSPDGARFYTSSGGGSSSVVRIIDSDT
ncbi:MAG: hypothetical protein AAF417_15000, partial [Pseudomonadota bacterium]